MNTKYNIGQSSEYKSGKRYEWSIWIEENDEKLDQIKSVTYYLHDTFPNPIRTKESRQHKFIMKTSGWGTFMIYIDIEERDGSIIEQEHYLVLEESYNSVEHKLKESNETEIETKSLETNEKKIFLSYSSIDQPFAEKVKDILKDQKIEVTTASDAPAGVSIKEFVNISMENSDLVLEIPNEYGSSSQETEIHLANEHNKKIVKIPTSNLREKSSEIPGSNLLDQDFIKNLF